MFVCLPCRPSSSRPRAPCSTSRSVRRRAKCARSLACVRIHQHDKDVRVPGDIIKESKKTAKPKAAGAKPKAKTAAAATTRPKSTSAAAATRPAAKKATSTSSTSTAGAKKKQETYVPPAARQRRLPVRARSTARSLRRL